MKKYIDSNYLPPRIPVTGALVWYLFLEHINADRVWYGVVGTLIAIVAIGSIHKMYTYKSMAPTLKDK